MRTRFAIATPTQMSSERRAGQLLSRLLRSKFLIGIIAIATIVVAAKSFGSEATLRDALAWIERLGPLAPITFIGAYVLAAIMFVPGAILTIGAGVLFGLVRGTVYVSVGATLGATSAFLIGRYMARDWVARKLHGKQQFKVIDRAVAREGWKIVGLARLSPIFPFNLLNYAFGLTDIPLKAYFLASWVGMIPGILMYVYIGTLVGDLARISSGAGKGAPGKWAFEVIGFIATIAVTVYVTRVARKALREQSVEQG
jgi:uncharacterized membrane protein YdjX (TVP38/TMEM64 family)